MSLHVDRTGSGPDLVLLHGWGLHSGTWDDVAPLLARRFRVHAMDLPGHGLSAALPGASFDEAAEAVAEALPRDAIVCGWSLGGLFAQRIARHHPGRVRAMALVGATPCFVEQFVASLEIRRPLRGMAAQRYGRPLGSPLGSSPLGSELESCASKRIVPLRFDNLSCSWNVGVRA